MSVPKRSWLEGAHDLVRPVVPAERLASLRVLTGFFALVYLGARGPGILAAVHQAPHLFQPVGPVKVLSAPAAPAVTYAFYVLAWVFGLAFFLGWRFRLTAPLFTFSLLWVLAYRNSWGMVFHTENLMMLHVTLLSLTDAGAAYSLDARRRGAPVAPDRRFGFGVKVLCIGTVTAYVLAGVAKLKVTGLEWATGDILKNHISNDNLRKLLLGDSYSEIGMWLAKTPWVFPYLAVFALAIELGAPVALFGDRLGRVWSFITWSFHFGVLLVMWIFFPYNLFFIAFGSFFAAERLVGPVIARLERALQRESAPMAQAGDEAST
jgi:hypothetical protein